MRGRMDTGEERIEGPRKGGVARRRKKDGGIDEAPATELRAMGHQIKQRSGKYSAGGSDPATCCQHQIQARTGGNRAVTGVLNTQTEEQQDDYEVVETLLHPNTSLHSELSTFAAGNQVGTDEFPGPAK